MIKKTSGSGIKNENISNKELADMQMTSKFNRGFRFLLCVSDVYSKCGRVINLKDK